MNLSSCAISWKIALYFVDTLLPSNPESTCNIPRDYIYLYVLYFHIYNKYLYEAYILIGIHLSWVKYKVSSFSKSPIAFTFTCSLLRWIIFDVALVTFMATIFMCSWFIHCDVSFSFSHCSVQLILGLLNME